MFQMSWSRDQAPRSAFTEVSDVFAQAICLHQPLHDGETYDVWIRATDVMSNTKVSTESVFLLLASTMQFRLSQESDIVTKTQLVLPLSAVSV